MQSDTQTTGFDGVFTPSEAMTDYALSASPEAPETAEIYDQPLLDAVRTCD